MKLKKTRKKIKIVAALCKNKKKLCQNNDNDDEMCACVANLSRECGKHFFISLFASVMSKKNKNKING